MTFVRCLRSTSCHVAMTTVAVRAMKLNGLPRLTILTGAMTLLIYTLASRSNWPEYRAQVLPVEHNGVFSEKDLRRFLEAVRNKSVVSMEKSGLGGWAALRRNFIMTIDDGSAVLIKWRSHVSELQGELYAYYLNCYLGLWNAPPTALLCVNPSTEGKGVIKGFPSFRKRRVIHCFVSTQYVQELKYGPYALNSIVIQTSTTFDELKYLIQWSDMIVFDYICGHVDRMTVNLLLPPLNLELFWKRTKNVASTGTGDLILIDHKTAFHIGYRTAEQSSEELSRQAHHFQKLSVFRKSTAERICHLCEYEDPASVLEEYIEAYDPVSYSIVLRMADKDRLELKRRLLTVCDIVCHLLSNVSNVQTA